MAHPDNIAAIASSTAHLTEDADDITYIDIAYSSYIMKNLASMEQISEEVSVFLLSRNNASFQEIYSSPWPMVFTVISAHIHPLAAEKHGGTTYGFMPDSRYRRDCVYTYVR